MHSTTSITYFTFYFLALGTIPNRILILPFRQGKNMKFLKYLLLIALVLSIGCALVACGNPPPEENNVSTVVDKQGVAYELNDDSTAYVVVGLCNVTTKDIVLPKSIGGRDVVGIKAYAFKGYDNIESVSIPESMTNIGDYAFYGCSTLNKITFAKNSKLTTIGEYAFTDCVSIATITLPNSLKVIGANAFERCNGIKQIAIPKSVETLSANAFRDCLTLKTVTFSNNSSLSTIGTEAFCGCTALSTVTLPEGLVGVSSSAFFGCSNLASLTLPTTLVDIEPYAFYGCAILTEVAIPDSVETIGASAFNNCQKLTSVTFGDSSSLISIGAHAYESCLELLTFDIPDSVKSIGEKAFYQCKNLSAINFGEDSSLETISSQAFVGCNKLAELNIPKSLRNISNSAFEACSSLVSVVIPDESMLTTIGSRAFYNCDQLRSVVFGEFGSLIEIGASAFYDCDRLINVDFGVYNTLNKIGAKAFYDCDSLFAITIPIDVVEIANSAFGNCYRLVEVKDVSLHLDIVKGSTEYGGVAKYAKTVEIMSDYETRISVDDDGFVIYTDGALVSLVGYVGEDEALDIPYEVTEINRYAFYKNNFVKTVVFELDTKLNTILDSAFESCSALKGFEVPFNTIYIGNNAFKNCKAVSAIIYNARNCAPLTAETNAFYGVGSSTAGVNLTIGQEVTYIPDYLFASNGTMPRIKWVNIQNAGALVKIGQFAFANNAYVEDMFIPSSVEEIGRSAFENTALKNVVFEDGSWLYAIPNKAFYNCTSLINVDFGENSYLTEVHPHAFENCTSLRQVSFSTVGNLIEIKQDAFKNCVNMTSITVPWTLALIEDGAFDNCYRLVEVVDGSERIVIQKGADNLGGIAKYALLVSDGLQESTLVADEQGFVTMLDGDRRILVNYYGGEIDVVVPDYVSEINSYAFRDLVALNSVKFTRDSNMTTFYQDAFMGCTALTEVEIPVGVTSVVNGLFDGCSAIKTVYYNAVDCVGISDTIAIFDGAGSQTGIDIIVGNSVVNIPNCLADGTKGNFVIKSIAFENDSKLQTIGDYAFAQAVKVKSLSLPDSLINIGNYAFKDCTGVSSLKFTNDSKLQVIGTKAFENCTGITALNLPSKVKSIAVDAFDGLSRVLKSITVASANKAYASIDNCLINLSSKTLMLGCRNSVIPQGVVTIANGAFKNCTELKSVVIPDSVKAIGDEAFYYCTGLGSIKIEGDTLTTIGRDAFVYCTKIAKIALPTTIKSIGSHAFLYCTGLKEMTYAGDTIGWSKVSLGEQWNFRTAFSEVVCLTPVEVEQ